MSPVDCSFGGHVTNSLTCSDAILDVPKGAFSALTYVTLQSFNGSIFSSQIVPGDLASSYVQIDFQSNKPVNLKLATKTPAGASVDVYRVNLESSVVTKLNPNELTTSESGYVSVNAANNGRYVAVYNGPSSYNAGLAVGLSVTFVCLALVTLAASVWYLRNRQDYCSLIRSTRLTFKNQI